ncbi:MAG: hypothetical protein Q8O93_04030 [bacterium]|nr:hypothetical protein [bacterium]
MRYEICFRNSSYVEEFGNKEFLSVSGITVNGLQNEKLKIGPFNISPNGQVCQEINLDQFVISKGTISYAFKALPTNATFNMDLATTDTARLSLLDRWISGIVFVFAFYGILILVISVFEKLKLFLAIIFKK